MMSIKDGECDYAEDRGIIGVSTFSFRAMYFMARLACVSSVVPSGAGCLGWLSVVRTSSPLSSSRANLLRRFGMSY